MKKYELDLEIVTIVGAHFVFNWGDKVFRKQDKHIKLQIECENDESLFDLITDKGGSTLRILDYREIEEEEFDIFEDFKNMCAYILEPKQVLNIIDVTPLGGIFNN